MDVLNYVPPEVDGKKEYQVIGMPEFVKQFKNEADHSKKRVWLETMYIMPSHLTDIMIETLSRCASRGLDSRLFTDGILKPLRDRDKLYSGIFGQDNLRDYQHRASLALEKKISDSGVRHIETRPYRPINNILFSFLRNHLKLAIVDDTVWIGGLNAGKDPDYNRIDYMMRIDSEPFATKLTQIVEEQSTLSADVCEKLGDLDIFVDRGKPGESTIYENVIEKIRGIKDPKNAEITILSPWVPDGKILDTLDDLHKRGANVTVITSHHKFEFALEGVYALVKNFNNLVMKLRGKKINLLYSPVDIHGKMLCIREGNENYSMITTHNLVTQGVVMGTTEIAVGSSNLEFNRNCFEFLEKVKPICSSTIQESPGGQATPS